MSFTGEGYIDVKDAEWSHDTELIPVDLNKLSARNFVVYKFDYFITRLVANHCQHLPVTLLIAEKILRLEVERMEVGQYSMGTRFSKEREKQERE